MENPSLPQPKPDLIHKPNSTRISLKKSGQEYIITIPALGFSFSTVLFLCLGIFFLLVSFYILINGLKFVIIPFFLIFGILFLASAISHIFYSETWIINAKEVIQTTSIFNRTTVYSRNSSDWLATKPIDDVSTRSYTICLYFRRPSKNLSLNCSGNKKVQVWLTYELHKIKQDLDNRNTY